jgi:hypothetical protein
MSPHQQRSSSACSSVESHLAAMPMRDASVDKRRPGRRHPPRRVPCVLEQREPARAPSFLAGGARRGPSARPRMRCVSTDVVARSGRGLPGGSTPVVRKLCALLVGALVGSLSVPGLLSTASAEQVTYQQVTPVGPYDAVPMTGGVAGWGYADYVTPDGSSVFFSTEGPFPGIPDTGDRLDIFRASRLSDGAWTSTWMSPGADTLYQQNTHDRYFEAASTDGTKVLSRGVGSWGRWRCPSHPGSAGVRSTTSLR